MVSIILEFIFKSEVYGLNAVESSILPRVGDYIDLEYVVNDMNKMSRSLYDYENYFVNKACLDNVEVLVKKVTFEICSRDHTPIACVFVEFIDTSKKRLNPTSNWHNFNYSGKIK